MTFNFNGTSGAFGLVRSRRRARINPGCSKMSNMAPGDDPAHPSGEMPPQVSMDPQPAFVNPHVEKQIDTDEASSKGEASTASLCIPTCDTTEARPDIPAQTATTSREISNAPSDSDVVQDLRNNVDKKPLSPTLHPQRNMEPVPISTAPGDRENQPPISTTEPSSKQVLSAIQETLGDIDYSIQSMTMMMEIFLRQEIDTTRRKSQLDGSGRPIALRDRNNDGARKLDDTKTHKERTLVPEVRECRLEEFKEYKSDQQEYVADVLVAGNELEDEVLAWHKKHAPRSGINLEAWGPDRRLSSKAKPDDSKDASRVESSRTRWIRQVQINSKAVLDLLSGLAKVGDVQHSVFYDGGSLTFPRPFSYLIHFHEAMCEKLRAFQERSSPLPGDFSSSVNAAQFIDELRCYVSFVENRLMPDFRRLRAPIHPIPTSITIIYEDLRYLFHPGQLIYIQDSKASEAGQARGTSTFQSIRRVLGINHSIYKTEIPGHAYCESPDCTSCPCRVESYYLDFDGESYGAVGEERVIKP